MAEGPDQTPDPNAPRREVVRFGPDDQVETQYRNNTIWATTTAGAAGGGLLGGPFGALIGGAGGLLVGAVGTVLNRRAAGPEIDNPFVGQVPANATVRQPTQAEQQQSFMEAAMARLDQLGAGMEVDDQRYLGLPPGFHAAPGSRLNDSHNIQGPAVPGQPAQRYTTVSPVEQFSRLSPEARVQVQNQLKRIGFEVDASGEVSQETLEGLSTVMSYANLNGFTWTQALDRMEASAEDARRTAATAAWEEARSSYVRGTYLAPSYETMAQMTKEQFRRVLGRDPKDYEIELLSEELSASARAAFDQQEEIREAEYLARAASEINAAAGSDVIDAPGVPGEQEEVDPVANFREKFEELYGGEIAAEQAEEDHQATSQRVIAGLTSIDAMMS